MCNWTSFLCFQHASCKTLLAQTKFHVILLQRISDLVKSKKIWMYAAVWIRKIELGYLVILIGLVSKLSPHNLCSLNFIFKYFSWYLILRYINCPSFTKIFTLIDFRFCPNVVLSTCNTIKPPLKRIYFCFRALCPPWFVYSHCFILSRKWSLNP